MHDRGRRIYERASQAGAFMNANAADFPAGSKGAVLAARLKEEMANVAALDVEKAGGAGVRQQATAGRRALRESLRAQLAAVCDTAEVVGRDRPEARGKFPRTRPDNSDRTLIAVARAFVVAATPLKALFVEYEMAPDFIERMEADAGALEAQMTRQTEGTGATVSTNAALAEALRRVEEVVGLLDVAVRNKYRNDHAKFAAWESAHHLERADRPKGKGGAPEAPPAQQ
jgi:hypothetical protein